MHTFNVYLIAGTEVLNLKVAASLQNAFLDIFYKNLDEDNRLFLIRRLRSESDHISIDLLIQGIKACGKSGEPITDRRLCGILASSSTDTKSTGFIGRKKEGGVREDVHYHGVYQ